MGLDINKFLENIVKTHDDNTFIQEVVSKYALPKTGFGELLTWLFYRIINAIKSIFTCSDWQVAKQKLECHMFSKLDEVLEIGENSYTRSEAVQKGSKALTSLFLDCFLAAKEGNPDAEKQFALIKQSLA